MPKAEPANRPPMLSARQLASRSAARPSPSPHWARAPSPQAKVTETSEATPNSLLLTPEDRDRAQRYVTKGNDFLLEGNVNSARLFYHRAAELGLADAAMALATTYDPNELDQSRNIRFAGQYAAEARKWYERAKELGASGARTAASEALQQLERVQLRLQHRKFVSSVPQALQRTSGPAPAPGTSMCDCRSRTCALVRSVQPTVNEPLIQDLVLRNLVQARKGLVLRYGVGRSASFVRSSPAWPATFQSTSICEPVQRPYFQGIQTKRWWRMSGTGSNPAVPKG